MGLSTWRPNQSGRVGPSPEAPLRPPCIVPWGTACQLTVDSWAVHAQERRTSPGGQGAWKDLFLWVKGLELGMLQLSSLLLPFTKPLGCSAPGPCTAPSMDLAKPDPVQILPQASLAARSGPPGLASKVMSQG